MKSITQQIREHKKRMKEGGKLLRKMWEDDYRQEYLKIVREEIFRAAANMDWQQVVQNSGPPCFHLENERFCGRAESWTGHERTRFESHPFISLLDLLKSVAQ